MLKHVLIAIIIVLNSATQAWADSQASPAFQCIAHRGNSIKSGTPENSLSAFRQAIELKADGFEFDIHHTVDGVAIVVHDDTLKRTATSKPGKSCRLKANISSLSFSEIRESCALHGGEDIPSLAETIEVLKLANGIAQPGTSGSTEATPSSEAKPSTEAKISPSAETNPSTKATLMFAEFKDPPNEATLKLWFFRLSSG